jgi:hypothetical protein
MKNKLVLGIFLLFTLITSSVFASMVENSRQGSPAISAISQPETSGLKQRSHQGFELRFLGFRLPSGIIFTDPFGLSVIPFPIPAGPYVFIPGLGQAYITAGTIIVSGIVIAKSIEESRNWVRRKVSDFCKIYSFDSTYESCMSRTSLVKNIPGSCVDEAWIKKNKQLDCLAEAAAAQSLCEKNSDLWPWHLRALRILLWMD